MHEGRTTPDPTSASLALLGRCPRNASHVLGTTWEGAAHTTVDATLASRYHERFADHAVGIAKKVKYLATGDWTGDDDARAEMAPEPVRPSSAAPTHPLESSD